MFSQAEDARINVQIVALDDTPRLRRCIESIVNHESVHAFTITCILNRTDRRDVSVPDLGEGVTVLAPDFNLGWAGGLHLARSQTSAEYLAWAQDDMVVASGWLDALVAVADAYPETGAVGSVEVDGSGRPNGYAGGYAEPADQVGLWNTTEAIRPGHSTPDTTYDWITSKGMLTRTAAWDDVRGTDPRLFPLNHADKDYSTHLRCHGWALRVATDAHILHESHRSAPPVIREFLTGWQEPAFNARWATVVGSLGRGEARTVPHECSTWSTSDLVGIERLVGIEASRMLVASARYAASHEKLTVRAIQTSTSWRATAPLRALGRLRRGSSPSKGTDRAAG